MFLDSSLRLRRVRRHSVMLIAAAAFAAGVLGGVLLARQVASGSITAPNARAQAVSPAAPALRSGHPAQVLRVIDGDTFEARVNIWPGMEITTKVRLRGIDAAELRANCEAEYAQAIAARDALTKLLAQGSVAISRIGQDRYGGRVDADVSTAQTPDVSLALLNAGVVRRYAGGRRQRWCNQGST